MTVFIIRHADTGHTVTPWDATPSERKAHRGKGAGFTVTAKDETTLRRTLGRYFKEGA
jgi:hypothetical protein